MMDFDRVARKITTVLFLSQSLSSAGFIAAFTVNALVGVELSGQKAMAGAAVFSMAAILIFGGLRPEPRDVGRELARIYPGSIPQQAPRSLPEIVRNPGVIVAMVTMAFAQMAMVVPMSITSVHMKDHQHALTAVSLVISAHTFGMYAFSLISGKMTDRWGRGRAIILGSAVLILSCLMAAPSIKLLPLTVALFLVGLGWNFAYVAGSTLLADQLSPKERAKTQGFNDLLLNLCSGASQIGSGMVYAVGGFGIMAVTAAAMAAVPLGFAVWWQLRDRPVRPDKA